ncbi:MAG: oxygen-independent coproporphyrinogen III oxidase [Betaproteobacteria bacterium]|nr:oxygen-independent coproporphyrinogen III oxidase [Betaproteobacteria bacterium]
MHSSRFLDSSTGLFHINPDLIRRFGVYDADYRLYPHIEFFDEAFDARTYSAWLKNCKAGHLRRPLSLYVHIPFCRSLCFYCQFNQIMADGNDNITIYLNHLSHEIKLQAQFFKESPKLEQLYFGGGTPTLLNEAQLSSILQEIQQHFNLMKDGEFTIEVDSRQMHHLSMRALKEMGFNSVIMGVQDFDHDVQQSIHRAQTEDVTLNAICNAQQAGFKTIRTELIYGLPAQTVKKFEYTLEKIITTKPHQINLLNYHHLPEKFKPQRNINSEDLPGAETVLEMLLLAISRLTETGYKHIGMNLFAVQSDQLVIAQRQGRLCYGLQGYSIYPDCHRIALGMSGIGSFGSVLSQNDCDLERYYDKLNRNVLPIMRGIELSADDLIRRSVMQALICHSILSFESVETYFPIEFKNYFAAELAKLSVYEQAGLVTLDDQEITVTPKGQLLINSICRVFDKHSRINQ